MPRSTRPISSSVLGPSGAGLQRHVGHPLDRDVTGGVGVGAAVGAAVVELGVHVRHRAVELVADQHAVLDDVPALRLRRPRRRTRWWPGRAGWVRSPVTFMTGRAVLQRTELVDGRERRTRVVGLVAERPVELGGVADGLVDGQPQVGRVDHQVVAAGLHGRRGELLAEQVGQLGRARRPSRSRAGEVLPAAADRRRDRAHGVEDAGGLVGCRTPRPRAGGGPAAGWSWCPRGRCRTCSPRPGAARPSSARRRARRPGRRTSRTAAPTFSSSGTENGSIS